MSLVDMLMEEGRDIWTFVDEGMFTSVKKGRADWRPHQIRRNDAQFFVHPWRTCHELAHMICCLDKNVNNPVWDFDHFIDTEGVFDQELTLREAEVLYVDVMLQIDRKQRTIEQGNPQQTAINDALLALYPIFSTPNSITKTPRTMVRNHLETCASLWSYNKMLDEALHKYELIRATR